METVDMEAVWRDMQLIIQERENLVNTGFAGNGEGNR
jgi:hypothetical protein